MFIFENKKRLLALAIVIVLFNGCLGDNKADRKTKSNEVELVVQDSGVGIPENLDIRNSGSLGMRLVSILAEDQLHGKINIEREEGTKFQIKFRV